LSYLDASVINKKTITIPVAGELVRYTIETHKMGSTHLPFLTLKPDSDSKAEPWLVIRGTDANVIGKSAHKEARENSLQSIMADFIDPKGISNKPIDDALDDFKNCFKELGEGEKKVNLAGHSLGGEYVQHLAVKLKSENLSVNIGVVYGFNSPGVPKATQKLYNSTGVGDSLNLVNFNKVGDIVPSAGKCLIGTHFRIKGSKSSPDVAHRVCDLHRYHSLQMVNTEAEEAKGARRLSEGLRKNLAGPALRAGLRIKEMRGKTSVAPWAKSYL
jgi:hypothetical protein